MKTPWPMIRLGEVLTERQEAPTADDLLQGSVPIVAKIGFNNGQIQLRNSVETRTGMILIHPGDLVVSGINAAKGAIAVHRSSGSGPIAATIHYSAYAPDSQRVIIKYLWWLLRSAVFRELLLLHVPGGIKTELKASRLLPIPVPLPPLDEQLRILARIEELAAKIEEARGLRREVEERVESLGASLLAQAFTPRPSGRRTATVTARRLLEEQAQSYSKRPDDSYNNAHPWYPTILQEGPYDIPQDWVWTDLGSVLTHLVDCVNDTPNFADSDTGLLGLKSTNIKPYSLELTQRWYVTPEDFAHWNRRQEPRVGDLVLTREAPMGHVCILPEGPKVCLTQRLMLLRTDNSFVNNRYLLHYLNSPQFVNQVLNSCRGLTTPHIRVQDAPFFLIPLAPTEVQDDIVSHLDDLKASMDTLRRLQTDTSNELEALLTSVLDKAFKGELSY